MSPSADEGGGQVIRVGGIDHVAINVKDLEKALEFYRDILGLTLTKRECSKPGVEYFLDCGGSLIGLIQGKAEEGKHLLSDGGVGGNHVAFRVKTAEFDRVVEELKRRNVTITHLKRRQRSWSVYFTDRDGNKLEITAWPQED